MMTAIAKSYRRDYSSFKNAESRGLSRPAPPKGYSDRIQQNIAVRVSAIGQ